MPYTPEQIATLKATDPEIVKQALAKMSDDQRNDLMASINQSQPQPSKGILGQLKDTAIFDAKNLKAGWDTAMGGLYGLGHDVAHAVGATSDKTYLDAINRVEQGQRDAQAQAQAGGIQAKALQGVGQAAPAVMAAYVGGQALLPASAVALPEAAGMMPGMATQAAPIGARAAATALPFGAATYATTPGNQSQRSAAGSVAAATSYGAETGLNKFVSPALQSAGNYIGTKIPWLGNASRATAEALGLPVTSETPWANAGWKPSTATDQATKLLEDLRATKIDMAPSEIKSATVPTPQSTISAENAVNQIKKTVTKNVQDLPFSTGELPKIAADPTSHYQGRAQAILDAAEDAAKGGDPTKILSSEADMGLLKKKVAANAVKDIRDSAAADLKGPMPNTAQAIDDRINFLKSDISTDHSAEIKKWELFKAKALGPQSTDSLALTQTGRAPVVGGGGAEPVKDIYGTTTSPGETPTPFTQGPQAQTQYPTPTFANGTAARSTLKDDIRAAYKGGDTITGTKDVPTLLKITKAIDADQEAMALASGRPDVITLTKKYNDMYSEYSKLATDRDIIRLAKNPEPDTLRTFLSSAGPADAKKYLDLAGPKGQAAYAQIAVESAFGKALNPRTGTMIPGNVSAGLNNAQDILTATVKDPAMKAKIDSLTGVLEGLARSNPAQASALGDRLTSSAVSAVDRTGLASMVLDQGKRGRFIDWAFNSPAGKDFLFRIKGEPPNSPMVQKALAEFGPKFIAAEAHPEQK